MNRVSVILLCCSWFFIFASVLVIMSSAASSENSWQTMSSMPTARSNLGVAVVDGKIYAVGGEIPWDNLALNDNERYDPATNTWQVMQPMPTALTDFGIAVYQSKIYCIGGYTGHNFYTTNVTEVYDTQTNTWSETTPIPTSGHGLLANAVNGKIYVMGGLNDNYAYLGLNEVFDPISNTWTTKSSMPVSPSIGIGIHYSSVALGNKIYLVGGNTLQIYDTSTDSWSNGAAPPTAVDGAAACVTTGVWAPQKIYVTGGVSSTNLVYDPERNAWGTALNLPTARMYLGVAVVDDNLYFIGGIAPNERPASPLNVNERYLPVGYGTVSPKVSIIYPQNNTTHTTRSVDLTFNVNRPTANITHLSYSLEGQAPLPLSGNTTLTELSSGVHSLAVYAKDTLGNVGTQTVSFTVAAPESPTPIQTGSPSLTPSNPQTSPSPNGIGWFWSNVYWLVAIVGVAVVLVALAAVLARKR